LPYLDRQVPPEDHKPNCPSSKIVALYERVYNDKGKRTWDIRALECINCGVILKIPHKYNTKRQDTKLKNTPKLQKILSENERLEIDKIISFRERTKAVQHAITRTEKKDRAKIKAFNRMYKNDEKYCPRLKGKIGWNPGLVERFLDSRPTYHEIQTLLYLQPLKRRNNRYANRSRGWVPNYENYGYLKFDKDCYIVKRHQKSHDPELIVDPDTLSDYENLVINEASRRMKYMEEVIKNHLENDIQLYHPVRDKEEKGNKI